MSAGPTSLDLSLEDRLSTIWCDMYDAYKVAKADGDDRRASAFFDASLHVNAAHAELIRLRRERTQVAA